MLTLGVAGHVDHGKTSLVRALTGIETDRLPEEQRRGISIELGFAWLDLPCADGTSTRLALVDMPGHERFVRRMISGAAGIDAVLLIVAADEGVMPQGREHLAICRLLGVRRGAVVLTKADLVDDEMLELVREDVAGLTEGTFLAEAPVWTCSVRDPASIAALQRQLSAFAADLQLEHATALGHDRPFRLAVDRAFTLHGRGTIVTGTATGGEVQVEQQLQVLPSGQLVRVRGLEQQGQAFATVRGPGRLAINLAAVSVDEVALGTVLATEGSLPVTDRIDALLHLLGPGRDELPLRRRAMLHVGTTQVEGTIVQLTGEPQLSGTDALVQVHLDRKLPIAPGEGFVVRGSQADPRNGQTLAGGRVLHPVPRRHKLGDPEMLAALTELAQGGPEAQVAALVELSGVRGETEASLAQSSALPLSVLARALRQLLASGRLRKLGSPPRLLAPPALAVLEERILSIIQAFHAQSPHRTGIEPDQLHRLVGGWLDASAVGQVAAGLVKRGRLEARGAVLADIGFQPKVAVTAQAIDAAVLALASAGLTPPSQAELAEQLSVDARELAASLQAGQAAGRLVRLPGEDWITTEVAREAIDRVIEHFADRASFTTGELKELLGLTRKYLIPFAEYLDAERITVRDPSGNRRIRDKARDAWRIRSAEKGEQGAES